MEGRGGGAEEVTGVVVSGGVTVVGVGCKREQAVSSMVIKKQSTKMETVRNFKAGPSQNRCCFLHFTTSYDTAQEWIFPHLHLGMQMLQ